MMIHKNFKILSAITVALLAYVFAPETMPEPARRVFFVFVLAALFWALELVPLYATSLSVVVLLTFLLCRPGGIMGMGEQDYTVFMIPFGSHIIMLFFGGLIIAEMMRKYSVDKVLASKLMRLFGTKPYPILFGFILITGFLSMWMSNTATTVMMIALIKPLLGQIRADDPFRTGLALAVPFAANIGGIGTPIGSPPNAIALGVLSDHGISIDFISWMKMALPMMLMILAGTSFILIKLFPPRASLLNLIIPDSGFKFEKENSMAIGIIVLTIVLWLTSELHRIPSALIALTGAGLFALLGLVGRSEFKNIDWSILILMWGGLALGKGLEISGLSRWIIAQPLFAHQGLALVLILAALTIAVSTFISNTATANLIVPIAAAIPGENTVVLVVVVGLCCSFAMALSVSTPPNSIAFSSGVLRSSDMLKAGSLVAVLALVVLCLGFRYIGPLLLGGGS